MPRPEERRDEEFLYLGCDEYRRYVECGNSHE
jgi:hypothetical protein